MKTSNNALHTQLVQLFEQYPTLTCLSHNEQGVYFVEGNSALHIGDDQIESIATPPDKIIFTLGNEVIYTVTLSQNLVQIALPAIEEQEL